MAKRKEWENWGDRWFYKRWSIANGMKTSRLVLYHRLRRRGIKLPSYGYFPKGLLTVLAFRLGRVNKVDR